MIQAKRPKWLPKKLRNWDFLPECLHSLEPYDRFIKRTCLNRFSKSDSDSTQDSEIEIVQDFDSEKILLDHSKLYRVNQLCHNEFLQKKAYK